MDQKSYRVTAIGYEADQLLETLRCATVVGTSLHGILLKHIWSPILYLSGEPFRGPLTINLSSKTDILYPIQSGNWVKISKDCLYFTDHDLNIEINKPLIWKPGPPPKHKALSTHQVEDLIIQVKTLKPDNPYTNLLDYAFLESKPSVPEIAWIEGPIRYILLAIASGDYLYLYRAVEDLLGAGPGLTPLGDDLILGILLAAYRTDSYLTWTGYDEFRSLLIGATYKTTMVSRQLLSIALKGSADERLIRVLDSLIAARAIPDSDLQVLLEWGSSSGVGVLVGMLLVLSRLESDPSPSHGSGTPPGLSGR
jgi:hypothetical protein